VKRAVDRGARLVLLEDEPTGLTPFAETSLKTTEAERAREMLEQGNAPVVVCGVGLPEETERMLERLDGKASFLPLLPGVNTRAALALGFTATVKPAGAAALYVIGGEGEGNDREILRQIHPDTFVVLQAAYDSPWAERADVLLPSAVGPERSGTLTDTLGTVRPCRQAVAPAGEARADWEILSELSEQLARTPSADRSARDRNTTRPVP